MHVCSLHAFDLPSAHTPQELHINMSDTAEEAQERASSTPALPLDRQGGDLGGTGDVAQGIVQGLEGVDAALQSDEAELSLDGSSLEEREDALQLGLDVDEREEEHVATPAEEEPRLGLGIHKRQATEPDEGDISGGFDEEESDEAAAPTTPQASASHPPILIHSPSQTSLPSTSAATSNGTSNAAPPARQAGHKRIESVAPQRYELSESAEEASALAASATPASPHLLSPSLEELSEGEDEEYSSSFSHRPTYGRRPSATPSETEAAGLDFVDVALDSAGVRSSPYGGALAMEGARSGVDIRADSIASGSEAAKAVAQAAAAAERQAGRKSIVRKKNARRMASSTTGSTRDSMESSSSGGAGTSSFRASRVLDGEGLYRGRRSVNSSRAASPSNSDREERSSRPSNTRSSSAATATADAEDATPNVNGDRLHARERGQGLAPIDTALGMIVASESGELRVVLSPATPSDADAEQSGSRSRSKLPLEDQMRAVSLEEEAEGSEPAGEGEAEATTPSTGTAIPDSAASTSSNSSSTANGIILTDAADSPAKGHARKPSRPSALEQHVSRTRMTTLPPKARDEDVKHQSDFEAMMKLYKASERKRAEEDEERKRRKDAELAESIKVWSEEILPSWTRARREAKLRAVWWRGAPPNLRGRVWQLACGNAQMLPRNLQTSALAAARTALAEGSFPKADEEAIERDIANTLPSLKLYQRETGPLYEDLRDVLRAYVMVRLDQLHDARRNDPEASKAAAEAASSTTQEGVPLAYQHGASSLAAMLLSNLTPAETLVALLNLLAERPWLRALYAPAPSGAEPTQSHLHSLTPKTPAFRQDAAAGFERVFDTLLADQLPKVYANMQARGVRPSAYVRDWVRTLFVPFLPFDAVARLWDCILLEEGDALIFRAGLALVKLLSARLYAPDREELTSILRGNNAAALRVWFRDNAALSPDVTDVSFPTPASPGLAVPNSAPSDARRSSVVAPQAWVPRDNIYAQYSITEEQLFQALEEQQEWWRDTTLERLLDRELS